MLFRREKKSLSQFDHCNSGTAEAHVFVTGRQHSGYCGQIVAYHLSQHSGAGTVEYSDSLCVEAYGINYEISDVYYTNLTMPTNSLV